MRIKHSQMQSFSHDLLRGYGVEDQQAAIIGKNLAWHEMVGRTNFGLLRLPLYVDRLVAGGLNPVSCPLLEESGTGMGVMDGDNGFGQYVGTMAMEAAIGRAKDFGTGIIAVQNSNFFGSGAWFTDMAAAEGLIGIAMSNSFPKVIAHGGLTPVFGTNPFAFGAPRRNGENILVDMATSALAGSTVRQYKESGQALPPGLAIDGEGAPITDPHLAESGALLPFGGAKGYGLALMVEILAGVIAGAGISHGVKSMYRDLATGGDNGHLMMAIDINSLMPLETYYFRLEGLIELIKASQPDGEVLLPGEIRWRNYHHHDQHGVELQTGLVAALSDLAGPVGLSMENYTG